MFLNFVSFKKVFLKYAIFYYGYDKGNEVYNFLKNESPVIVSHLENNTYWNTPFFKEIRFLFQHIENIVSKYDVKTYLVESPYEIFPDQSMTFEEFLKESYSFYANLGEKEIDGKLMELYFCSTVFDTLFIYDRDDSPFSTRWVFEERGIKLAELHACLQDNADKIFKHFKKSYRELTQEEFRYCFDNLLQRKDASRQLADALWQFLN